MKKFISLGALALVAACNSGTPALSEEDTTAGEDTLVATEVESTKASLSLQWESDTVLLTNESVLYDESSNKLYVSNIVGQPTDKDGNGFISILNPNGKIEKLKWATGLDAPKGMGLLNGKLYVTNINELVEISLADGKVIKRYPVEGAQFLNDVAIGDGMVYISDMSTGKLHQLKDGKVTTLHENLAGLNGLAYANGELMMLAKKGMLKRDKKGNIQSMNELVTGGDGLIIIDEDTYLASRWQGEVWLIDQGEATVLLDSKGDEIQTADIGYIPEEQLVLVPRFFSNKVSAYKLVY